MVKGARIVVSGERNLLSGQIPKDIVKSLSLPLPALVLLFIIIIINLLRLIFLNPHLLLRLGFPRPDQPIRMRGVHLYIPGSPSERSDSVSDVRLPSASTSLSDSYAGSPQPFQQRALEEIEHQQLFFVGVQHDLSAGDVLGCQ